MHSREQLVRAMILAGVSQFVIAETFAAPSGNAVILWNANAGVAATKACIAPLDDPFHESYAYATMHILTVGDFGYGVSGNDSKLNVLVTE